jgi:hypothetical protein
VLQPNHQGLFGGRGDGAPAKHFIQFVLRKLPKPFVQTFRQRHPEARVQHDPDVAPSAGDQVRRFLIDSERRVIVHCRKLLDDQNLPTEDHPRLTRLLGEAEARLQDLASQAAMQN